MPDVRIPPGSGHGISGCAACGRIFLNLTAFDRHQVRDRNSGAFTGACLDPSTYGQIQGVHGIWGTPEGHSKKEAFSAVSSARWARKRTK